MQKLTHHVHAPSLRPAGYKQHPTTMLLVQMATLQTAEDLLEQLRGASFEAAKRDLEDVQAFAAEQGVTEPLKQVTWHICFD